MGSSSTPPFHQTIVLPALLSGARHTYKDAVKRALIDAGCTDMPHRGSAVLIGSVLNHIPVMEAARGLRLSKQRVSQLIDTLVIRGYLQRSVDTSDRRRIQVALTDRGNYAATVIQSAITSVDDQLVTAIGIEHVQSLREALGALITLRDV